MKKVAHSCWIWGRWIFVMVLYTLLWFVWYGLAANDNSRYVQFIKWREMYEKFPMTFKQQNIQVYEVFFQSSKGELDAEEKELRSKCVSFEGLINMWKQKNAPVPS